MAKKDKSRPGLTGVIIRNSIIVLAIAVWSWFLIAFLLLSYIRGLALDLYGNYCEDSFYYVYRSLYGAFAEEGEQPKTIEELAEEISGTERGEEVALDRTIIKTACAVYQPEEGEIIYYPEELSLSLEEKDMISIRRSHAYPDDVRAVPVMSNGGYNQNDDIGQLRCVRSWNVNTGDDYFEVKILTSVDYSDLFYSSLYKITAALATAAVVIVIISIAAERKRMKRIYSDCDDTVADMERRRAEFAATLDTPINVIIGSAEGIRTAGDNRADNIIKNAEIIRDTLLGTETDNAGDHTD